MATIRLVLLSAVVVLLSAVTFTEGLRSSSGPTSCCFEFSQAPVKQSMVKSYTYTSQKCSKEGVLFTMKRGRLVCAKPTDPWVQKYIKALDSKLDKVIGGQGSL